MLKCLQNCLPQISCESACLPAYPDLTLTQVYSFALLGAPLVASQLASAFHANYKERTDFWKDEHGPGWMRPHIELMMAGREWTFPDDADESNSNITRGAFAAVKRWVEVGRKLPPLPEATTSWRDRKLELAALSDGEALAAALEAGIQIQLQDAAFQARSLRFFHKLNEAIFAGDVVLKAIPINRDGKWLQPQSGMSLYVPIPIDHFNQPLAHHLFEDVIEVAPETEEDVLNIDRVAMANEAVSPRWKDPRLSPQHARELLERFDSGSGIGQQRGLPEVGTRAAMDSGPDFGSFKQRRGRRPGAGAYPDDEIVDEMERLLRGELSADEKRATSPTDAARMLLPRAFRKGNEEEASVVRRLVDKHKRRYGSLAVQ